MVLHNACVILSKDSFRHESEFHAFPRLNEMIHYENKLQLFMVSCSFTSLCWLCDPVNHFICIFAFIAGDVCTYCNLYAHCLSHASLLFSTLFILKLRCHCFSTRTTFASPLACCGISVTCHMNIMSLKQLICASDNIEEIMQKAAK